MRTRLIVLALLLAGCQQQARVQVTPGTATVSRSDTTVTIGGEPPTSVKTEVLDITIIDGAPHASRSPVRAAPAVPHHAPSPAK